MPERVHTDALISLISVTTREIDSERLHFTVVSPDTVFDDGTVRASFIPTAHMKIVGRPSYSILFEAEGKRILFSGDLSQHLLENDFPTIAYEKLDAMVLELAHFGIENLAEHLGRIGAKKLFFNHVYPLTKYDDIGDICGKYPYEIITPCDMDEFEI